MGLPPQRFDPERISQLALQAIDQGAAQAAALLASRDKVLAIRRHAQQVLVEVLGQDSANGAEPAPSDRLAVHRRLKYGLPGTALIQAGALLLDTLEEQASYYGITVKTLRERLKLPRLGTDDGERALRMMRVVAAAAQVKAALTRPAAT